jgi:hypothetical protein
VTASLEAQVRDLVIDAAIARHASRLGADGAQLTDSLSFRAGLGDPQAPDFEATVAEKVRARLPAADVQQPAQRQPARREPRSADAAWTAGDAEDASGSQLQEAIRAGQLQGLGIGTARQRPAAVTPSQWPSPGWAKRNNRWKNPPASPPATAAPAARKAPGRAS